MNPRRNLQTRKNRRKRNQRWDNKRHIELATFLQEALRKREARKLARKNADVSIPTTQDCGWVRADSPEWKAVVRDTGMMMALRDLERMMND